MERAMLKILLAPIIVVSLTSFLYYWIAVSKFPIP